MRLSKQTAPTDATALAQLSVARQPIFGTAGDVIGYELLYRRTPMDTMSSRLQRRARAADVVVRALLNMGLDQLTSGRAAYVNFTRDMLLSGAYARLPREGVVVELGEDVEPDDEVETACEELVDAGYTLALDRFAGGRDFDRLLELATIVKIDVLDRPAAWLDEVARELALYDVRLLADRVETAQVRAMCMGLGYELFQGCYYTRLETVRSRALASDEVSIIQAMNVLRDARANRGEWESLVASNVELRCRLLRMVNTAALGERGIESTEHARFIGRDEMEKWLALLLVSSIATRGAANRELLNLAIQRARLCELLALPAGRARDTNACFLVGLFSLLDAISGIPLALLLESIALPSALCDALLERRGPYASLLAIAEAYEQGEWSAVRRDASFAGIDAFNVGALYVQSLAWTRDRLRSLNAT